MFIYLFLNCSFKKFFFYFSLCVLLFLLLVYYEYARKKGERDVTVSFITRGLLDFLQFFEERGSIKLSSKILNQIKLTPVALSFSQEQ